MSSAPEIIDAELLNEQGNVHFKTGRFAEALKCYDDAVKAATQPNAKFFSNRSAALCKLGRYAKAYLDGKEASRLRPEWPKGLVRQAAAMTGQGHFDEAAVLYERALVLDPNDRSIREALLGCRASSIRAKRNESQDRDSQANMAVNEAGRMLAQLGLTAADVGRTLQAALASSPLGADGIPGAKFVIQGHLAFESGDLKNAAAHWEKAADMGNAEAMGNLAILYSHGSGVQSNQQKCLELLTKAAAMPPLHEGTQIRRMGVAEAQYSLGLFFHDGRLGEPDLKKAFEWFERSASNGNVFAHNNIAVMYENARDFDKAVAHYRISADAGFARAQYNLGLCYEHGRGVPVDISEAKRWFASAAEQNFGMAMQSLAALDEDPEQTLRQLQAAANTGLPSSMHQLGQFFEAGKAGTADHPKALEWFLKAARTGHHAAKLDVARYYRTGFQGVPRDLPKALHWMKAAANSGSPAAAWNLSIMYEAGEGCAPNQTLAMQWLKNAAKKGFEPAVSELASRKRGKNLDISDLTKWEQANPHLAAPSGATANERWSRFRKDSLSRFKDSVDPSLAEFVQSIENRRDTQSLHPSSDLKSSDTYDVRVLASYPNSSTAMRLLEAKCLMFDGAELCFDGQPDDGLRLIAAGYRVDTLPASWPIPVLESLLATARAALKKDPNNDDARFVVANLALISKKIDIRDAIAEYDILTRRCPTEPAYFNLRGCLKCFLEQWASAADDFSKAIALDVDDAETIYLRGVAYRNSSMNQQAIKAFEEFLLRAEPDARKVPDAYY
eukprot:TRINITY_DN31363_c0_g1_i1.p1 TRINITY_DN31363_c0_g1~~TRINITY_DN31363_c0_g1_i1.p1  ORF type:complete len:785 (-),score=112.86 TRINITY_DN31363_c0_g1_i1:490-2844(-)